MKPDEIDRFFAQAAQHGDQAVTDGDAMERVEAMLHNLRPVRPLAPEWVFLLAFLIVFAALGTAAATALGMHGLPLLNAGQRASIFASLLAAAWLASVACIREMRPASGRRLSAFALLVASLGFPLLFSLVFRNYSFLHFTAEGVPCLVAGLSVSIPTGVVLSILLRRGFVMDWSMAGVAAGTLSGLAGLGMLELHCPNLKAIHVMTWHTAVVVVSGVLGFAAGWIADEVRRRKAL